MTGQQLKNSILQMAVQGKLVPQDPNDEPASVLIERIRAEKEQLIKEGKIKREKNPSRIFRGADNLPYEQIGKNEPVCIADEVPFEIPDSWEWVRLGSIGESNIGLTYKPSDKVNEGGFPVLRSNNIQNGKIELNDVVYVSCDIPERAKIEKNDILICARNGSRKLVGKSAIIENGIFAFGAFMAKYTSYLDKMINPYILIFLESPAFRNQLEGVKTETINQITQSTLKNQLIPLPPLEEQKRIVNQFDFLKPIILEYANKEDELTNLNFNFPDQLKKSILQEAVMGKLVPQDENDEPASVLLERIREEKQRLIAEGKIKKDKNESIIFRRDNSHYEKLNGTLRCIDDEIPFEIPHNWAWCRLGHILIKLTDGTHSTPKYTEEGIHFLSVKDMSSGSIDFSNTKFISEEEHTTLYERCDPKRGDILITKVGTTGIPVYVNTDKPFSLFVSVAQMRFSHEFIFPNYLMLLLQSPLAQKQCTESTRGVGNKNWVMRDIANTLICIPPFAEQQNICEYYNFISPLL